MSRTSNDLPDPREEKKDDIRTIINMRLWYALGDINPTEDRMIRAVETVLDLLSSERQRLIEKVKKMHADVTNGKGDEYLKKSDVLTLLNKEDVHRSASQLQSPAV